MGLLEIAFPEVDASQLKLKSGLALQKDKPTVRAQNTEHLNGSFDKMLKAECGLT